MTGLSECLVSAPSSFLIALGFLCDRGKSARYEPDADLISHREQPCSERYGQLSLMKPASHIRKLDLGLQIIPCGQPSCRPADLRWTRRRWRGVDEPL